MSRRLCDLQRQFLLSRRTFTTSVLYHVSATNEHHYTCTMGTDCFNEPVTITFFHTALSTNTFRQIASYDIIYENDQQDTTVQDSLLFLGCSTCFERYFRSSSGASKLYYSFWYDICMSLPAGSDIRM